ncbi:hypothetical protein EXN66_Car014141 [Channa argus]|uniref:Immunoglobulin domain-containing protein n=1 Tax=Channa argus TaxID=215402 RepID=A0A6G1Q743_CHAAH|nr:hypothetical protein EXN66_Car014141 [Channa argus]
MKTPSVSLLFGVSVLLSGFTVSADHLLVLKFSEDPVMTGSDVTLQCKKTIGDFVEAYFFFNETKLVSDPKIVFIIHKVQRSDEGFYSCSTDVHGKSPQVQLRVRDPPTTSDPHTTTSSTTSDPQTTTTVYTATAFNNTEATASTFTLFLSVIRFFPHVMVFCSYCICTVLMMLMCCSRKTGNKPVVSMEMTQDDEEYDDITGVTTKHDLSL